MKKIIIAVSFFAALVMSGCRPETRNQLLGIPDDAILLSTENFSSNDTKTAVSGNYVYWVNGDMVDMYVGTGSIQTRSVVVSEGNAYIASALTGDGVIRGYYPSGNATSSQTSDAPYIKIPNEYNCDVDANGRQVIQLPMVAKAESGATSIQFKHLTAAINVVLKNSITSTTLYVDSVTVIADYSYLSTGSSGLTINLDNDSLGVTFAKAYSPSQYNLAQRKVKVYFPTGFVVAAGSTDKTIQVPVRPFESDYLTINVYCRSNSARYVYSYKPANKVHYLSRNNVLTAQVDLNTEGHMKATHRVWIETLTGDITAMDGDTLMGTITTKNTHRVVNIADGATVTLHNINITASTQAIYLQGDGNCTVNISGTNTLQGSSRSLISVNEGSTITIQGTGSLTGNCSCYNGACIGSYVNKSCGNIIIKSGTISVNGGMNGAGIGGGSNYQGSTCGYITIQGGDITATGGSGAAGIGTGNNSLSVCGNITISGVTNLTATKGSGATASIGRGHASSTCGTVTVMGEIGEKTDNYTYPTAK